MKETSSEIFFDKTGTLMIAATPGDLQDLRRTHTFLKGLGIEVEPLTLTQTRSLEPSVAPHLAVALRSALDVQVDNRLVLRALEGLVRTRGVELRNASVTSLRLDHRCWTVFGDDATTASARFVVVFTGASDIASLLDALIAPHLEIPRVRGVKGGHSPPQAITGF